MRKTEREKERKREREDRERKRWSIERRRSVCFCVWI